MRISRHELPSDYHDVLVVNNSAGNQSTTQLINQSTKEWHDFPSICIHNYKTNQALLEKQLKIKKSILPNAGKGLFTKKTIPKGTRIVEYKGRITTWKEVDHQGGDNRYIFYVKRDHVIDAGSYKKALARYANDARGLKKIKGLTNNASYVEDGLRVFIEAKKDIPAHAEILVDYGKEYWDIIKYNENLSAKK